MEFLRSSVANYNQTTSSTTTSTLASILVENVIAGFNDSSEVRFNLN